MTSLMEAVGRTGAALGPMGDHVHPAGLDARSIRPVMDGIRRQNRADHVINKLGTSSSASRLPSAGCRPLPQQHSEFDVLGVIPRVQRIDLLTLAADAVGADPAAITARPSGP